jgi:hypothetical protein
MSTTIRQAVHGIVKEHNAISTTAGSLKLAIEKFLAAPKEKISFLTVLRKLEMQLSKQTLYSKKSNFQRTA